MRLFSLVVSWTIYTWKSRNIIIIVIVIIFIVIISIANPEDTRIFLSVSVTVLKLAFIIYI